MVWSASGDGAGGDGGGVHPLRARPRATRPGVGLLPGADEVPRASAGGMDEYRGGCGRGGGSGGAC